MSTSIIVVGASGRMGKTISGLVEADPQFTLAGLVDSPERIAALAGAACPVSDSLAALLPKLPGPVVIDFTAPAVSLQRPLRRPAMPLLAAPQALPMKKKTNCAPLPPRLPFSGPRT